MHPNKFQQAYDISVGYLKDEKAMEIIIVAS
jgi:hypothetical protein